jgi:hypothetical protein
LSKAKRFFGIRSLSGKLPSDTGDRTPRLRRKPAWNSTRWKRTAALALVASIFFVATAEQGLLAVNKVNSAKIVAVLKNPLSLFADRSPGGRGSGPLHLTKAGPHERVLASIRERNPAAANTPVLESSPNTAAGPGTIMPVTDVSPEAFSRPLNLGPVPFTPIYYDTPIGYPGTPGSPDSPPGDTPPGGDTPPITATPEPATWTLMLFGLFAVAGAVHLRQRKVDRLTR